MRERISRELILHKGFDFIAIEGDWPDAAHIDHYVRHREYAASEWTAFARFPAWMWRNTDVRSFVTWLRSHNVSLKPDDRVAFHGLDLYSLYDSIRFVLEYLDRVDPAAAKIARERYGCLTPWQSDPATYGRAALNSKYPICEDDVVDALKDLLGKRQAYAGHDGERFLDAVQNARLVTNAERYYRIMYYGSRASWNLRDGHMFETLKALLAHHGPHSKGIVWAHNSHIGDASATEMSARGEFNIGQLCRKEFGNASYAIGFGTDHGTVAAATDWGGPMEIKTVRPAMKNSYEKLCHDTGLPRFMLPLRDRTSAHGRGLLEPRLERAIGVIYRPESELASHYFEATLPKQFDEYIWFDQTTRRDADQDRGTRRPARHLSVRSLGASQSLMLAAFALQQTEPAPHSRGWSNLVRCVEGIASRVPFSMLHSPSSSIESKASWVVAMAALVDHADGIRRRLDHRGGAQGHRRRSRRLALDPGAGLGAGLARLRRRRHHDGAHRRPRRHALDRDLRLADDRPRPRDLDLGPALAAVDRPRLVHRPVRARRHQCAALHLCQPLVRPQARLGAGADLERQLSRRRHVAAGVRARHRQFRLAAGDAVVRGRRDRHHRSAGADLFPSSAGSHPSGRSVRRHGDQGARARPAGECRVRDDVRRRGAVLHPDGDAARPSGRVLQRSRHQPGGRRLDAVGAARHRVPQPANLGRDFRPHRRSLHRADRLALAMRRHDRVSADAERGRPVHGSGRLRARLFRHHPGLCAGAARIVSGLGSLVAHSDAVAVQRPRHGLGRLAGRLAVRSFRLLRTGLRRRHRRQYSQSRGGRTAGGAPAPARGHALR